MNGTGYLIEYQRIGMIMKATAIDPVSGLEAVIQGPAGAGEQALAQAAIKKLEFLLRKRHENDRA